MTSLMSDLRIAARMLRRSPGVAVPAIVVLALGIGATTAVFSVVDHILLRPLPLPDSGRLVTLCETQDGRADSCRVSTPDLMDWSRRSRSFSALGAGRSWIFSHRSGDGSRPLNVGIATPGFFEALGIAPARGRLFGAGDQPPAGEGRVALVGHDFWTRELGGDPAALGSTITLDDHAYTIVGILGRDAFVPRVEPVALWIPIPWDPDSPQRRDWRGFVGAGRLAPGVTLGQAQAEIASVQSTLIQEHPRDVAGWQVRVASMRDQVVGSVRPVLLVFFSAVALILVLVCANTSALLLARAASRTREVAIRFAMGASRWRVMRQFLAESLTLSLAGGAAGVLVAVWAVRGFLALAPAGIPRLDEVGVDARILAFALLATLATGLVFGLIPVLRMERVHPAEVLRAGRSESTGRAASRARRSLVAVELALALILVSGAVLLLRSFAGLLDWSPGFDTRHVLAFQVFPAQPKYPTQDDVRALYRRTEEALAALPEALAVSTASAAPLIGGGDGQAKFLIQGRSDVTIEAAPTASWFDVGPGYFSTLGIPLLRGRGFTEADDDRAPLVVLVNQAMASRWWKDGNPVGSRLSLPEMKAEVEVIGVVGDVVPFYPGRPPAPELYFTNRQYTRWGTFFVLRTREEPADLSRRVTAALAALDPDFTPSRFLTLEESIASELVRPRFNMLLIGLFALVAMTLGAVGVYGVVTHTVESSRREIGIRMALGAGPRQVARWIVGQAAGMVLWGSLAGLTGAILFNRLLVSLVYGVSPMDPASLAAALVVLVVSALAAVVRPAWRAGRTDPLPSLRTE